MHSNAVSDCPGCLAKINQYADPPFHPRLAAFLVDLRHTTPDAHVAVAGRDYDDQMEAYTKGLSRARFGESAHNYNLAFDLFRLDENGKACFEEAWYRKVLPVALKAFPDLEWSGEWKDFHEYDHVEVRGWKKLTESLDGPYGQVSGGPIIMPTES